MRFRPVRSTKHQTARGLYLVPDRRIPKATHAPAGRTLHLVDLENLMGGPMRGVEMLMEAVLQYQAAAHVATLDHAIIAVNPALALHAGLAWPSARLLSAPGENGADLALVAQVADRNWVAARYDRLVIGSGDGIFASEVAAFRALGVASGVVSQKCRLSRELRREATFVCFIASTDELQSVA
jgi:hypothetical protein